MEGFFTRKETESDERPDGKKRTCVSCGLYQNAKTPKMKPSGGFRKKIMNISISPSRTDDRKGKPFTDPDYRELKSIYKKNGIDLYEDCLNLNAIHCYCEKATLDYVASCRKTTLKIIKKHKPDVIVLFGIEAVFALIGHRWKKDLGGINKWQGFIIPDQDFNAYLCPTFSLSQVLDNKSGIDKVIFEQNIEKISDKVNAIAQGNVLPRELYKKPEIIYLKDDLSVFDDIKSGYVAFDYETTGLKPHAEGHRIVCASVAVNHDKVYVFMVPKSKKKLRPFIKLLRRRSVLKIAQNMKYEDTWSNVIFKTTVNPWFYDTMLASHIIDNRSGITGLKFQAFVQLGVVDYDSDVAYYLKAVDNKNGNAINRIDELLEKSDGEKFIMKYCALDSIYEYRLAHLSMKPMKGTAGLSEISPVKSNFPLAYKLLHDGTLALARAERQGFRIDTKYCERQKKRLTKRINKIEKEFFSSKFYRHWQHTTKNKINLNSGEQLGNYLYNVKKIKPAKLTTTGKGSTDEEALQLLKIPELDLLLERSKLLKIRDTYLEAFVREQVDGFIHPFFNLNTARTYRSSSNNPNFQNIPKRDEKAMKIVRKAIYPREGHQLIELDYSGIEVSIAATYHKDPTMMEYLNDPKSDMHGDMTKQIFMIDDWDRKTKQHSYLRSCVKNTFVFPQFYGDYYKNCASNACGHWLHIPTNKKWTDDFGVEVNEGVQLITHLRNKGINNYADFENHIKGIENHFWSERFPVYAKWKERHYKTYLKQGYVSLYTGFVCKGVMGKNDVINYPVQGAAFHCLLWTFTELDKLLQAEGMDSKLVGQIHDAVIIDAYPDELLKLYEMVQFIGTQQIKKEWKWINVPLEIEAELCPVDGSWAEKKEWRPDK